MHSQAIPPEFKTQPPVLLRSLAIQPATSTRRVQTQPRVRKLSIANPVRSTRQTVCKLCIATRAVATTPRAAFRRYHKTQSALKTPLAAILRSLTPLLVLQTRQWALLRLKTTRSASRTRQPVKTPFFLIQVAL